MTANTKNLVGWMTLSAFYAAGRKQYAVYCIWMGVVVINSIIFMMIPKLATPTISVAFMAIGWAVAYALHRREMRTGTFGSISTNWWKVTGAIIIYIVIISVPIVMAVKAQL